MAFRLQLEDDRRRLNERYQYLLEQSAPEPDDDQDEIDTSISFLDPSNAPKMAAIEYGKGERNKNKAKKRTYDATAERESARLLRSRKRRALKPKANSQTPRHIRFKENKKRYFTEKNKFLE